MKTKKLILVTLCIVFFFGARVSAQNQYYWSNSKRIPLVEDNGTILIKAKAQSEIEVKLTKERFIEKIERLNKNSLLIGIKQSNLSTDG